MPLVEPVADPVVDPVVELPLDEPLGLEAPLAASLELPADTFVRMNWLLPDALLEDPLVEPALPDVPVAPIDPAWSAGWTQPVSVIVFESLLELSLELADDVGVWLDGLPVDCAATGAAASTADARIPITN